MDEEKGKILQMLSEGKISAEEAEELLEALEESKKNLIPVAFGQRRMAFWEKTSKMGIDTGRWSLYRQGSSPRFNRANNTSLRGNGITDHCRWW